MTIHLSIIFFAIIFIFLWASSYLFTLLMRFGQDLNPYTELFIGILSSVPTIVLYLWFFGKINFAWWEQTMKLECVDPDAPVENKLSAELNYLENK